MDEIRDGRQRLLAAAKAHDRDPASLSTVAFGLPGCLRTAVDLKALRALEVDHSTVWLDERGDRVFDELEALAREALG